MQKVYKVELKLMKQQIQKINQSLGICIWLYNTYLAKNQSLYQDFKDGKLDKKKGKVKVGLYFTKNNKTYWKIERHKVNITILKWIKIKHCGYIPIHAKVINETVTKQAGKYYVSMVCKVELEKNLKRERVRLSRKYESLKKPNKTRKGEATIQNIRKQIAKVQRLHQTLTNIRTDYILHKYVD